MSLVSCASGMTGVTWTMWRVTSRQSSSR